MGAGTTEMFSTCARRYGLLLMGRVRSLLRASQLEVWNTGKNGRADGSTRYSPLVQLNPNDVILLCVLLYTYSCANAEA